MLVRTETFRFAQAGITAPNDAAAAIEMVTASNAGSYNISPTVDASCELLVIIAGGVRDATAITSLTASSSVDGAMTAKVSPADNVGRNVIGVFYLQSPTSGSHTITVTKNGGGTMTCFWIVAMQLKDVDGTTPFETDFDYVGTDATPSTDPLAMSGSVTTTQANSLLIAFAQIEDPTDVATLTLDGGLSLVHDGVTDAGGAGADCRFVVGTEVIASAGAAAWEIDASATEDWAAGAVAVMGA